MEPKPGNYSVWSPCITAHMNSGKRQHQPEGKYKEKKIKKTKQNECQNSTTSRRTVRRCLFRPHFAARIVNPLFIFISFGLPHYRHALYIVSSHVNLNKSAKLAWKMKKGSKLLRKWFKSVHCVVWFWLIDMDCCIVVIPCFGPELISRSCDPVVWTAFNHRRISVRDAVKSFCVTACWTCGELCDMCEK